jgi:RNA polymerase-binding transcription factor DksA
VASPKDRTRTIEPAARTTSTLAVTTTRTAESRDPCAVGPTAGLQALPQLDGGLPSTLAGVDDHLARIERARQAQLDALPPKPDNVVASAHRRVVARILEEVLVARARIREGTYGTCAHCASPINTRVLDREPWQTTCGACDTGARRPDALRTES